MSTVTAAGPRWQVREQPDGWHFAPSHWPPDEPYSAAYDSRDEATAALAAWAPLRAECEDCGRCPDRGPLMPRNHQR